MAERNLENVFCASGSRRNCGRALSSSVSLSQYALSRLTMSAQSCGSCSGPGSGSWLIFMMMPAGVRYGYIQSMT